MKTKSDTIDLVNWGNLELDNTEISILKDFLNNTYKVIKDNLISITEYILK